MEESATRHLPVGRRRDTPRLMIVALALTVGQLGAGSASAQSIRVGPDPKVCALLPVADLEAHYGGKASPPNGITGSALSTCRVTIARHVVSLQVAPPGAAAVPSTVAVALQGVQMLASDAGKKNPLQLVESKDLGGVGCATMKLMTGLDRKQLQTPLYTTTCFLVDGGCMTLALADEDPKRVTFDVVRPFLEKAAQRRK